MVVWAGFFSSVGGAVFFWSGWSGLSGVAANPGSGGLP